MKQTSWLLIASTWVSFSLVSGTEPSSPRLSAYLHLDQCIDADASIPQRQQQIEQAIESMRKVGIEAIVPYVSTTSGAAHYPSQFLGESPWGQWDPVAEFVQAARKHGLQVHLCVPVLACGHDQPAGILLQHPDWALRNKQGQPIGSISPGHPEARRWIVDWLAEIVHRYQPDGMLLDYMRYASEETKLDPVSAARWAQIPPTESSDGKEKQRLQEFREELLTELMRQISDRLRRNQPKLKLAIYSWGYHVTHGHRVGQAWPGWAAQGYIDEVNVSGYWYPQSFSKRFGNTHIEAFQNSITRARQLLIDADSDARLTFALGIKTSHGEVQSIDDIATYLRLAKKSGTDGTIIFTWSYLQKFLPQLEQAGIFDEFATAEPAPQ